MASLRAPIATYRVQLSADFDFNAAAAIVPYLQQLGIGDLYCSPVIDARSGSEHGYDVVDPLRINGDLGGREALYDLAQSLRDNNMHLLLDIVPNHLAVSSENRAWIDVLEHGASSPYAQWFDFTWPRSEPIQCGTRIDVPVLGADLDEAVANGELNLCLERDALMIRYHDWRSPFHVANWQDVLDDAADTLQATEDAPASAAIRSIIEQLDDLPPPSDETDHGRLRRDRAEGVKQTFALLLRSRPAAQQAVEQAIASRNKSYSHDHAHLHALLDAQCYRLCSWQDAYQRVCYRRFFDITELVGVRVEDPVVFLATHRRVLELIGAGIVTALRIDHIDGLADPRGYVDEIQQAIAERVGPAAAEDLEASEPELFPVLIEKILEGTEEIPHDWPVDGTTGYDFLNALATVFIDSDGLRELADHHAQITGIRKRFSERVIETKREIARNLFAGELRALVRLIEEIRNALSPQSQSTHDCGALSDALIGISACLPVYRTYIRHGETIADQDRQLIEGSISAARASLGKSHASAMDFIRRILLRNVPEDIMADADNFIRAWQQFTGPLMAKGLEDTALYRDARLISLNEVGVSPEQFDDPRGSETFHEHNRRIARDWPLTMTATATHDTKRSEDMRARLHVLADLPDQWRETSRRWMQMNEQLRRPCGGTPVPAPMTELFIYQTLLGVWPLQSADHGELLERISQYIIKALREAKESTSWLETDEAYESAVIDFVRDLLDHDQSADFLDDFHAFRAPLEWFGALNSLAQVVLKIASPGVPDIYQGTELWDFRLVDPDNRIAVDFDARRDLLENLPEINGSDRSLDHLAELMKSWRDGRIKLHMLHRCLLARQKSPALFTHGEYLPLTVTGERSDNICAFARVHENQWIIALAATHLARFASPASFPLDEDAWNSTRIVLPDNAPPDWHDELTGARRHSSTDTGSHTLDVARGLQNLPVALLSGRN